ncbi:hypothetical protein C6499_19375 [Candidatus Poribacteria bacterium]|nr:MAG: hypothetical protein C6499_19375 [Candidatus Poribacteria bacterium]
MVKNDVQLIHRILDGDDGAFTTLVQKYQKSVHALAWRKVGDFHVAEEITQDTFLQVYKKLVTLKNPNQFAGWLYVIANRLCINWVQRRKPTMQSLEDTSMEEIEESSHAHHISAERETEATERRSMIVKKLLEKLPESERTVVTLYYLGEMDTKAIGRFLGVSVNTITSRLQRARKRLQAEEELLIHEVLGSVQLPINLTENIVRQVTDVNPPSAGKPSLPWAAFGAATVLVILLLGVSSQYIARFQKPYSFEAQSEPTIEIVDAPIVLDTTSKPDIQKRLGRAIIPGRNDRTGSQVSETVLASNTWDNSARFSGSPWTQVNGLQGGASIKLFSTSDAGLYAIATTGLYRLANDGNAWSLINTGLPIEEFLPITEHRGTLYLASHKIFTSADRGETWRTLGDFLPRGYPTGLVITNGAQRQGSQTPIAMYLALLDKGIFRSTDAGKRWTPINDGLTGKRIYALTAVENTMFAGTNRGLYRLNSGVWEQLPIGTAKAIYSLEVFEKNLYVSAGPDLFTATKTAEEIVSDANKSLNSIYHSTDLGTSWTDITPKDKSVLIRTPTGIRFLLVDKTFLTQSVGGIGVTNPSYTDGGQTWTNFESNLNSFTLNKQPLVAVDEQTFYRAGIFGVQRTTDGGNSWHAFTNGMVGTMTLDLVHFNDRLYAHTSEGIFQSTDGGVSWESVYESLYGGFFASSKLKIVDNVLYVVMDEGANLRVLRLSADDNTLIPVENIPDFDGEALVMEFWTEAHFEELKQASLAAGHPVIKNVPASLYLLDVYGGIGGFAVSGETVYTEFLGRLFKWKPGDTEWTNTGLVDIGKRADTDLNKGFKLAVSAETIYVGKRNGGLFQSFDGGDSWRDVTSNLPLRFSSFKEIIFVGSTVYVATDKAVLASQAGTHWRVIADKVGAHVVIDKFAVDGTTVYGIGDTGVYRLDKRGKWHKISPSAPKKVVSLVAKNGNTTQVPWELDPHATDKVVSLVARNDKLYIATFQLGVFHLSLEEE